ncbi:MAG TPA: S1 family peptidase [Pseudonocardiaceae bacterium]
MRRPAIRSLVTALAAVGLLAIPLLGAPGSAAPATGGAAVAAPDAVARLDALAAGPSAVPPSVAGWYPRAGGLVVTVVGQGDAASARFVAAARSTTGVPVRVERVAARPTTLWALNPGMILTSGPARCTMAAAFRDALWARLVLTAGHCTEFYPATWYGPGGVIGPVQASEFPGDDFGLIRVASTSSAVPSNVISGPGITPTRIIGVRMPAVGERACRVGATTGLRCGSVQALNQTVNYAQGVVYGLIRTNICSEPGDSGGPLISPPAAGGVYLFGVVSGGSGNCTVGGTTFAQPATEVMARYGLTLL